MSQHPPSASQPAHVANCGIRLTRSDRQQDILVVARGPDGRDDPAYEPFIVPRINAAQVEQAVGWLRHVRQSTARPAAWLMYLDMVHRSWTFAFPPQVAGDNDIRCNLRFGGCPESPPPHTRLAGVLRTASTHSTSELTLLTPGTDGLYLFWHPAYAWLHLTAIIRVEGVDNTLPPEALLHDTDRGFPHFAARLWATDSPDLL